MTWTWIGRYLEATLSWWLPILWVIIPLVLVTVETVARADASGLALPARLTDAFVYVQLSVSFVPTSTLFILLLSIMFRMLAGFISKYACPPQLREISSNIEAHAAKIAADREAAKATLVNANTELVRAASDHVIQLLDGIEQDQRLSDESKRRLKEAARQHFVEKFARPQKLLLELARLDGQELNSIDRQRPVWRWMTTVAIVISATLYAGLVVFKIWSAAIQAF